MASINSIICKNIIVDSEPYFDPSRCDDASSLTFISFNMHGFNQGKTFVKTVLDSGTVDFVLIQEHWLPNSGLYRLEQMNSNYVCFAISAMEDRLGHDVLFGRPFGGIAIFVKQTLSNRVIRVCMNVRCIILKVDNLLLTNVYLPSHKIIGTENRPGRDILNDILDTIISVFDKFRENIFVCGGDFNCDSKMNDNKSRQFIYNPLETFRKRFNMFFTEDVCQCATEYT